MNALLEHAERFEPRLIPWRDRFDNALVRYDTRFLVLLVALMALALVLATAVSLYCIYKGKRLSGGWSLKGLKVQFNCV